MTSPGSVVVTEGLTGAAFDGAPSPRPTGHRRLAHHAISSGSARKSNAAPTSSGVFPNPAALLRLAGAVLVEAHDEGQVSAERRYPSERSMALIAENPDKSEEEVAKPQLMTA